MDKSQSLPLVEYINLFKVYFKGQQKKIFIVSILLLLSVALKLICPIILKNVIDISVNGGESQTISNAAILYIGLALLFSLLNAGTAYIAEHLGWTTTNRIREELSSHCLSLDMNFHKKRSSGEMIERIDGDVTALANFLTNFVLQVVGNFAFLIGVLIVLANENWTVAAIFAVFSIIAILIINRIRDIAMPHWLKAREASSNLFAFVGEKISGLEDIKSNNSVSYVMRNFYKLLRTLLLHERKAFITGRSLWPIMLGVFALGFTVVLSFGGYLLSQGLITIGTLYLMYAYMDMLRAPLEQIAYQIQDFQKAGASVKRIKVLLSTESKLLYSNESSALPEGPLSIEFKNVSFSYDSEGKNVIKNLSFNIQPNKVIGLLGRTGSGKTTISRLLFRLYDSSEGEILLGGVNINGLSKEEISDKVGLVTQEVKLFHASVRDNLTLFNKEIEEKNIWRVLHDVGLEDWVMSLPQGLDSVLETSNTGLSSGQEQLLSFARIFLRNPQIIVLDEATSKLDPTTEKLVNKSIQKLLKNRTAIIIAHRLETINNVDEILILESGNLVEYGDRRQLINNTESQFYKLNSIGLEGVL